MPFSALQSHCDCLAFVRMAEVRDAFTNYTMPGTATKEFDRSRSEGASLCILEKGPFQQPEGLFLSLLILPLFSDMAASVTVARICD